MVSEKGGEARGRGEEGGFVSSNQPPPTLSPVHLALELCSGGELFDSLTKRGHYSEACAAALLKTVVETVAACHEKGIVHRDLKPENLLLIKNDPHSNIKVTDFGLSAYWKVRGEKWRHFHFFCFPSSHSPPSLPSTHQPGQACMSDVVGTPYYVAPEVREKRGGRPRERCCDDGQPSGSRLAALLGGKT